jgi:hypothetical protein
MPEYRLPRNVNTPVYTHIMSLVQRSRSIAYITESVRANFKGIRSDTIRNYTEYARGVRSAARAFQQSGQSKSLQSLIQSSRKSPAGVVRVGYRFTFRNNKAGETQTKGFSIDLPVGLSKKQAEETIRATIRDWAEEHYDIRDARGRFPSGLYRNLQIVELEGI